MWQLKIFIYHLDFFSYLSSNSWKWNCFWNWWCELGGSIRNSSLIFPYYLRCLQFFFKFNVIKKNQIKYGLIGWYLICEQYKRIWLGLPWWSGGKTACFHCRVRPLLPGWGSKIVRASWPKNKKGKENILNWIKMKIQHVNLKKKRSDWNSQEDMVWLWKQEWPNQMATSCRSGVVQRDPCPCCDLQDGWLTPPHYGA